MKRTLLSSLAVLAILVAGLALTGCSSGDSSGNQNMPEHQHSH